MQVLTNRKFILNNRCIATLLSRFFALFSLATVSVALPTSASQTSKVWLDIEHVELSRQSLARYKNILTEAFDKPVEFVNQNSDDVQIRISNKFVAMSETQWHNSRYLLDLVPGFSLTTRKNEPLTPSSITGIIRRPYLYQSPNQKYLLDDMNVALSLLENKRIDGIVDYTTEGMYYIFEKENLNQNVLLDSTSVLIFFTSVERAGKFDELMEQNIGIEKNQKQLIEDVVPLSTTPNAISNEITLSLILKQFDPIRNALKVTKSDSDVKQWLTTNLPEYRFHSQEVNTNKAYESLAKAENHCILNTSRNPKRLEHALFSQPTFAYLDFQLYVKVGTPAHLDVEQHLKRIGVKEVVDISLLISENPNSIIGYYEYINRTKHFTQTLERGIKMSPDRFVKVTSTQSHKSEQLLRNERIDYLVTFPVVVQQEFNRAGQDMPLMSYPFKYYDKVVPAFIACSKSEQGKQVIQKVDQLLSEKAARNELVEIISQDMIPSDKKYIKRAFIQGFE